MEILEVVEDRNVEIEYLPSNVRNHCVDISHLEWEQNTEIEYLDCQNEDKEIRNYRSYKYRCLMLGD
jgi:hypothetical protein